MGYVEPYCSRLGFMGFSILIALSVNKRAYSICLCRHGSDFHQITKERYAVGYMVGKSYLSKPRDLGSISPATPLQKQYFSLILLGFASA